MNHSFAQALSAALGYGIVSKAVIEQGQPIGFLYREAPVFEHDSGWRFFAGDESDGFAADPDNFSVCPMADLSAKHPEITALLTAGEGAWEWDDDQAVFVPAADWQPQV